MTLFMDRTDISVVCPPSYRLHIIMSQRVGWWILLSHYAQSSCLYGSHRYSQQHRTETPHEFAFWA